MKRIRSKADPIKLSSGSVTIRIDLLCVGRRTLAPSPCGFGVGREMANTHQDIDFLTRLGWEKTYSLTETWVKTIVIKGLAGLQDGE